MYNQKYRVFHPRGYLSILATTGHKFSCSTNSGTPLNFVQHIKPTHQPLRMVCDDTISYSENSGTPLNFVQHIKPTHQPPRMVCDSTMHLHPGMRCLNAYAMHYATACQFPITYVMHDIWTIYHFSWTIISKAYNFQTIHLNVNILEFIYQHSLNNYHQVSQSKASKDNLVLKTNCGIRNSHKQSTHMAITGHTNMP